MTFKKIGSTLSGVLYLSAGVSSVGAMDFKQAIIEGNRPGSTTVDVIQHFDVFKQAGSSTLPKKRTIDLKNTSLFEGNGTAKTTTFKESIIRGNSSDSDVDVKEHFKAFLQTAKTVSDKNASKKRAHAKTVVSDLPEFDIDLNAGTYHGDINGNTIVNNDQMELPVTKKPRLDADYAENSEDVENGSLRFYELAAAKGDAEAQNALGEIYESGKDVPADTNKAFNYYKQAAMQGHVRACANLASYYMVGIGTDVSIPNAIHYFTIAAAAGNPYAQTVLGHCYEYGYGIQQDFAEARRNYIKAAQQEYPDALYNLGRMYEKGIDVEKNMKIAIYCYQKAVDLANPYRH